MPRNNELLDDPLIHDGSEDFSGGEVSLVKPSLLAPNQVSGLVNVDVTRTGRLVTRRGTDKLGSQIASAAIRGMFYYDKPATELLLASCNGGLHKYNGATWSAIASATMSAADKAEMAQLIDRVYAVDGTNAWQWDGTTLTDLTSPSTGLEGARYVASHVGRIFAAGYSTDDEVRVSNALDGAAGYSSATNQFQVGGGEGQGITGMTPWHNFLLLVFKRGSIYAVDADPNLDPDEWQHNTIDRNVGCVAGRTIQQVGTDVFFLSDDGVRSVARTINDNQIGVSEPLSTPIQPLINRINWTYANTACSAFYNNRYMVAVPLDNSTSPNCVLVYNTVTKSWTGRWTGWSPLAFAVTKFNDVTKVTFGQSDGNAYEWLNWKKDADEVASDFTDDGTDIPTEITFREFNFGDPTSPKTGNAFEIEFYASDTDATVEWSVDQGSSDQSYSGRTNRGSLILPFILPAILPVRGSYRIARDLMKYGSFRGIQCTVRSTEGKLSVQGIQLTAFSDTTEEEKN